MTKNKGCLLSIASPLTPKGPKIMNNPNIPDYKKLILDVHLTEYSRLREEIIFFHSQKGNAINFSFLALTVVLTIFQSFSINRDYYLLISTFPFFGILWYVISIDNNISHLSYYLRCYLAPKINELINDHTIKEMGIAENVTKMLGWEEYTAGHHPDNTFIASFTNAYINSGRIVIVVLPMFVLFGTFIFLTKVLHPRNWTGFEYNLILANIFTFILFALLGFMVRKRFERTS